ncbi:hypothetical protein CVT24_010245 [Panaeolus cyanescens]|uniref:Uncharacterized protein n=1 Tax=Panaeolus cyanescens TaxID=181874 RepID=A0A409YP47_9AGAR|nr:hypothetical protein CVT24_010245 [Panaeolus cyanescens]
MFQDNQQFSIPNSSTNNSHYTPMARMGDQYIVDFPISTWAGEQHPALHHPIIHRPGLTVTPRAPPPLKLTPPPRPRTRRGYRVRLAAHPYKQTRMPCATKQYTTTHDVGTANITRVSNSLIAPTETSDGALMSQRSIFAELESPSLNRRKMYTVM